MNLVDSALDRGDAEAAWARLAALAEHRPPDVVGRVAHAVRAEVIGVAARLGVDAVVGRDAVRSRLAGTPKLLHIATHAGVAINGGWLAMADGRLSPGEVLSRRLRAGTVVLAGCASAAGPGLGGAGSIGSAFLAAGGRTVVATLRSVDDGATAAFVRALYAAGVETDAVAAVAIAQRQMIREMNREMIHDGASAWSAYVALGSVAGASACSAWHLHGRALTFQPQSPSAPRTLKAGAQHDRPRLPIAHPRSTARDNRNRGHHRKPA